MTPEQAEALVDLIDDLIDEKVATAIEAHETGDGHYSTGSGARRIREAMIKVIVEGVTVR
jgi:hypothetical protein